MMVETGGKKAMLKWWTFFTLGYGFECTGSSSRDERLTIYRSFVGLGDDAYTSTFNRYTSSGDAQNRQPLS